MIIDAYAVRNLAAFINFSCGGDVCNLKAESVKAEHRDAIISEGRLLRDQGHPRGHRAHVPARRGRDEPEEPLEGAVRVRRARRQRAGALPRVFVVLQLVRIRIHPGVTLSSCSHEYYSPIPDSRRRPARFSGLFDVEFRCINFAPQVNIAPHVELAERVGGIYGQAICQGCAAQVCNRHCRRAGAGAPADDGDEVVAACPAREDARLDPGQLRRIDPRRRSCAAARVCPARCAKYVQRSRTLNRQAARDAHGSRVFSRAVPEETSRWPRLSPLDPFRASA